LTGQNLVGIHPNVGATYSAHSRERRTVRTMKIDDLHDIRHSVVYLYQASIVIYRQHGITHFDQRVDIAPHPDCLAVLDSSGRKERLGEVGPIAKNHFKCRLCAFLRIGGIGLRTTGSERGGIDGQRRYRKGIVRGATL
jgi:hypothetical protein